MKIEDIENKINVSNFKYEDFNFWPIIKLKFIQKVRLENRMNKFSTDKKNLILKLLGFFISFYKYTRNRISKEKIDILYLTRSSDYTKKPNNEVFNQYVDPMLNFVGEELKIKILEINNINKQASKNLKNDNINLDFVAKYSILKAKIKRLLRINKILTDIDFLKKNLDLNNIENELSIISGYSKEFEKILKKLKPKAVYIICFYDLPSFAMSLACHRLKIKVIEYQHGFLNDYNNMYTNWKNLPNHGFELLPDIFWVWAEDNAKKINKWSSKTTKHKAIVGGNIYLSYRSKLAKFEKKENISKKKNILVVLQFTELPEFFINYLKKNKDNFNWYFRYHPLYPIPDNTKFFLNSFAIEDIQKTSARDLHDTFSFTNLIVTLYSTVAFEAQIHKIPTIFMGDYAKKGFKNLLGKNGLFYAKNEFDLNNYLNNLNAISRIDKVHLEFDANKIKKVIKDSLN